MRPWTPADESTREAVVALVEAGMRAALDRGLAWRGRFSEAERLVPPVSAPVERVGEASVLDELEWEAQPRHVRALVGRLLRAGAFVLDGRPVTARENAAWEEEIAAAIEEGEGYGYIRGEECGYDRGVDDGYMQGDVEGYQRGFTAGDGDRQVDALGEQQERLRSSA